MGNTKLFDTFNITFPDEDNNRWKFEAEINNNELLIKSKHNITQIRIVNEQRRIDEDLVVFDQIHSFLCNYTDISETVLDEIGNIIRNNIDDAKRIGYLAIHDRNGKFHVVLNIDDPRYHDIIILINDASFDDRLRDFKN